jgi:hypothetical protein
MINFNKLALRAVFFLFLVSCSDINPEFTPQNLLGTWEQSQFNAEVQLFNITSFIFEDNGTFEYRGSYRQQDTTIDLGYYFLITGNYILNGNKLIFSNTTYYTLPDDDRLYVLLEELVPVEGNENSNIQTEISTNSGKTELTMYRGLCTLGEDCLGPRTFYKVK